MWGKVLDCTVAKNNNHGVFVCGEGSRLEAEECTLEENGGCGVIASVAAEVVVSGCDSTDNGVHGFFAEDKATLTASDCSADGCKFTGFAVFTGARAGLKKCKAAENSKHSGCKDMGFALLSGARAVLQKCTAAKNRKHGV